MVPSNDEKQLDGKYWKIDWRDAEKVNFWYNISLLVLVKINSSLLYGRLSYKGFFGVC